MTSRRRRRTASIAVIAWRSIPAQVVAVDGDARKTAVLTERFQNAIDRAAGVAGLTETNEYVAQWTREEQPLERDIASAIERIAASLESAYDTKTLEILVRNGGYVDTDADLGGDRQQAVS